MRVVERRSGVGCSRVCGRIERLEWERLGFLLCNGVKKGFQFLSRSNLTPQDIPEDGRAEKKGESHAG